MNLFAVTEVLNEEGISHRSISPTSLRLDWLIDGASRPVIVFDLKANRITPMSDHKYMPKQDKERLRSIVRRCKLKNVH
ncbi:hypothetical protein C8U37_107123 [Trichococcus patagoniensis]|uniref:Uncharacterized protein n=1 Tax=Trichococcus patagoniensis TaxID=382641 RepID=A0A2T5ILQ2_9LACT|nr:hypothetical protein [Trichococcus patagoniensis]PTQ84755.1 hypothetical protein C8U37_107123 [Trichococcus patagoniensis]